MLKCILFLLCKAAFSSVSHDPSETSLICFYYLIFGAHETLLIIISVENGYTAWHFCGNSFMNGKFKRTAFIGHFHVFVF